MSKQINHTDKQYGALVAISRSAKPTTVKGREAYWLCQCQCGNQVVVKGTALTRGTTKSCGCISRDLRMSSWNTHGLARGNTQKLYNVWKNMMSRCYNTKNKGFRKYGERGISVCLDWHDVKVFVSWATQNGYAEGLQIDRMDNDGNYEPTNCRFVTNRMNCRNTRTNKPLTISGETKCIAEWSEDRRCVVGEDTLRARIRLGWSNEAALLTPSTSSCDKAA